MSDLNKVILCGRLTRNQEIKYTNSGDAIGNFSIAVNESYNRAGQKVEKANFFEVSLFGKVAESLNQYLITGKQVNITGRLRQERWEKDGRQNQRVKVLAETIQLLGGGKSQGNYNKPVNNQNNDTAFLDEDGIPF